MTVVYFLQAGESGPVKIGRTGKIDDRFKALQTGHYEQLRVVRKIIGQPSIERWAHRTFSSLRIRGEWFRFDPAMLVWVPRPPKVVKPIKITPTILVDRDSGDAQFVSSLRKALGLSQADFGSKLGVSGAAVSRWEDGNRGLSKPVRMLLDQMVPRKKARRK